MPGALCAFLGPLHLTYWIFKKITPLPAAPSPRPSEPIFTTRRLSIFTNGEGPHLFEFICFPQMATELAGRGAVALHIAPGKELLWDLADGWHSTKEAMNLQTHINIKKYYDTTGSKGVPWLCGGKTPVSPFTTVAICSENQI